MKRPKKSAASGSPPNVPAKNDCSEEDAKSDEEDLVDMSTGELEGQFGSPDLLH